MVQSSRFQVQSFDICNFKPRTWNLKLKIMHCEEGYLCDVCGKDVENIWESDLYLRYVIGLIDPETLHTTKERHITCNPALAQFIVDPEFPPIIAQGDFSKDLLDPEFVKDREELVTRGWWRLG